MRTWLHVHHVAWSALALAMTAGVVAVAGDVLVPVPNLSRGDLDGVPLALIAPLAASAVLVRGVYAGPADLEAVAVRPTGAYRAGLVAAACVAPLLAGLLLAGTVPYGMAAARNLAGFTGLALVASRWRRDAATAVPAAYMIAAMLLGGGSGTGSPWDWAITDSPGYSSWAVPATALAFGLTCSVFPGRGGSGEEGVGIKRRGCPPSPR
ncbi:hypothetical protein ACFY3V_09205 [Streptosporangium sp. NPDC000095]|uniref:hypothetical protein n=1 Tax=Streptosporangium sp. NPDC000095 TaxID=3366184 RepID=UPI0036B3A316